MAIDQDPYRTLGLARGASIEEIKRAYRRLAKIHHPDAAGERNVPRFLAIQAAYEQLVDGSDGKNGARRPSAAPRRPWEADPDRSDATRRAYGGRPRGTASGGAKTAGTGGASKPSEEPSAAGSSGASSGSSGSSGSPGSRRGSRPSSGGSASAGGGPRSGSSRPSGQGTTGSGGPRRTGAAAGTSGAASGPGAPDAPPRAPRERKRKAATLGSTSYDGVDGPFEPDWRGASWYGTTSGTYWTLNPKEYADPRKHGPEYQARARRATRSRAPDGVDAAIPPQNEPEADDPAEAPDATARPTHTTSSWWESTAGPTEAVPPVSETPHARPANLDGPPPPPPDLGLALASIGRALTDPGFGGQGGRVMRAILGWLPIAFGVSWFVGEMTGCGRFAATCTDFADPMTLVIQVVALAVLLLFPLVGSIAAMGAVALLTAAVIAALILSATGGAADTDSRRSALGAVLLIAWLAGIAVAVARRIRAPTSTTRPVS